MALKDLGHSNRKIATMLGVNEASVRRGLRDYTPSRRSADARLGAAIREALAYSFLEQ